MKNKQLTHSMKRSKSPAVFLMLFMAFILMSYAGFAQQSTPATADKAKVTNQAIQSSNPGSILMNLVDAYPQDEYLIRAVSMQKALDNPAAYPQLSNENLEEYKAKLGAFNIDLNQYSRNIANGDSPDEAYYKMVSSRGNSK